MRDENELTMVKRDRMTDKPYIADRQTVFTQVVVDYNEFIQVNSDDISGNQEMLTMAVEKVAKDVKKIFVEAIDKGIFTLSEDSEYAVRLVIPMLDSTGEIPTHYFDRNGAETTGYGFSTTRRVISSLEDLDALIEDLFSDLPMVVARYVLVNSAAGMGFTGFMIERLLK